MKTWYTHPLGSTTLSMNRTNPRSLVVHVALMDKTNVFPVIAGNVGFQHIQLLQAETRPTTHELLHIEMITLHKRYDIQIYTHLLLEFTYPPFKHHVTIVFPHFTVLM